MAFFGQTWSTKKLGHNMHLRFWKKVGQFFTTLVKDYQGGDRGGDQGGKKK